MESSTVGFIGQTKGRLTKQCYRYTTIFVNNYSRYVYVYLQKQLTSKETLQAKHAFEVHCRLHHNVSVKHYHADNGWFADNMFLNDVVNSGQTISYCGVNAHWQNGIAEQMIRSLREVGRTQLLHAVERWHMAYSTHLWPYAISYSDHVLNQLRSKKGGSPLNKFTGVDIQPNVNHLHTFGCPVFALNNKLAAQQSIPHWHWQSRLGIYLGPALRHAKTISLVMNPSNVLISPQFHVKHDEFLRQ